MSEAFEPHLRVAMWSGPRNLSTAMMRSFGSRKDTVCVDEPFYAAYLDITGHDHPMRDEILARHETDPLRIIDEMLVAAPAAPIFYQKQMTHHMVEGIPRHWVTNVRNVFLIRHPARVLASYAKKMKTVSLDALGFAQQLELFNLVHKTTGEIPIVIDSDDILRDPRTALYSLCTQLDIVFDEAMLSWAPGGRAEDGAWAPHWYDAVFKSTGFGKAPKEIPDLPTGYEKILDEALEIYHALSGFRIQALPEKD